MRMRCAVAILLGFAVDAHAMAQPVEEYRLKAAFIFNFTRFVEWPAESFKSPTEPISICVFGRNPFGDALEQAVHGHLSQGRPVVVRSISDAADAAGCHELFLPASERKQWRAVLDAAANHAILTVGEADSFLHDGGVVNLRIENGTVRIQVRPEAAARQQIVMSSKLLGLAEIVR
jgi:hypothetical protein